MINDDDVVELLKSIGQAVSADENEDFKKRIDDASKDPQVRAVGVMLQHLLSMGDAELAPPQLVQILIDDLATVAKVMGVDRDAVLNFLRVLQTIERDVRAKQTAVLQAKLADGEHQNAPSTDTVQ